MNVIEMCQSVGRVIRPAPDKQFGNIVVPTYSNNVGIQTSRRLHSVYETAFVDGEPVVATMKT
jgi:predicted helicase